jgi:diguanylate cyclase (GGDEF)-like protein
MTAFASTMSQVENASHKSELRVVLVGRTGLDGALRLDPAANVRRAHTCAEAIGELTDAPAHAVGSGTVAVVVVPGVAHEDRVASFLEAVRTLCPDARVFALGPEASDGFDGVIRAGLSPADLSRVLRGLPPEPPSIQNRIDFNGHLRTAPDSRLNTPSPASPDLHGEVAHLGAFAGSFEREMLEAVLSGKDPRAAGATVATRIAGVSARVLAPTADATLSDTTPIVHGSRVLGHLQAPGAQHERLLAAAEFLAPWLKLGAQQDQLRAAAFTDELTGAFNRRYFVRFLSTAIEQAKDKRHAVTLLIFDVDNFKQYNDSCGHAAGDEILTQTVKLLASVIRPTDRVCRIGGDEFAVIFHDPEGPRKPEIAAAMGPRSIAEIAARFQKQITEHRFPKLADRAMPTLTISGGMATFPWDGRSVQELMDRADELAMQSKRQGKNSITYGPGAERECRECP